MSLVEVYFLPIESDGFDVDLKNALAYLDEDELARYKRFKNEHAQQCFLQARRIIKTQLAKKLDCRPRDVCFSYTETEKPVLCNSDAWHFNISHSHGAVAVAISSQPVGIDVEDVDRCKGIWKNAEAFLNPYVADCVNQASSDEEATAIFAEHWSCTESYIKLKGSAIYREKDRVQSHLVAQFDGGKHFEFEEAQFVVFDTHPSVRMSVAAFHKVPAINMMYWRSGRKVPFFQ